MKRAFDIVVAVLTLVLCSPFLAIAAVLVKVTSPGPVFYGARRAGLNGRAIRVWKFRTMVTGADQQATVTVGNDSRITTIGRLLRATKIDEFPQFWNILKGEMSLVGPRPESLDIVEEHYTTEEREVLTVLPGLTGTGNLVYYVFHEDLEPPDGMSANDFYARHLLRPKLLADLHYVRTRTFAVDLVVLIETAAILLGKWAGVAYPWQPKFASPPPDDWRGDRFRESTSGKAPKAPEA